MNYFLYKLIPPRQTYPQDMTEAETEIMQQHVAYWSDLADKGIAVVFGPVSDPKGAYGLAIVEEEDEATVHNFGTNDPAIKAGVGFRFEVHPMPQVILRK